MNTEVDSVVTKRRAIAARLLTFLCVSMVAGLMTASAAVAAPPVTPKLLTTNPATSAQATGQTTTPAVLGEAEPEEGVIIESAPGPLDGPTLAPVPRATANPAYEIQIFGAASCAGAALATGTAEALEASGIVVAVAPDTKTVLSARQVDPARPEEPSGCSNAIAYWEGNVPAESAGGGGGEAGGGAAPEGGGSTGTGSTPGGGSLGEATPVTPAKPTAPRIHTEPSGRARDMTPDVVGSASRGSTVLLFSDSACNGSPIARLTTEQLAAGLSVAVAANAATTFTAAALTDGQRSPCSEPATYFEDSNAPRTRITMGPGVKTRKHRVVFRFQDVTQDPPGTTFACRVDKVRRWRACSSPFPIAHLKPGHHKVTIRATDLAGNVEKKPVKRKFVVIRR